MALARAAVFTFGCKVNQHESEKFTDHLVSLDWLIVPFDKKADLYIINSCSVTSAAEQKGRRLIRAVGRQLPVPPLVVVGCYPQVDGERLSQLFPNAIFCDQNQKKKLAAFLTKISSLIAENNVCYPTAAGSSRQISPKIETDWFIKQWNLFEKYSEQQIDGDKSTVGQIHDQKGEKKILHNRSRPTLLIQQGCDNKCSFCIIPRARGTGVSYPHSQLVEQVNHWQESGYREIIVCGINISRYFSADGKNLAQLLEQLIKKTDRVRFRLSSLQPNQIDAQLLDILSDNRICGHFHLSLQSASKHVLALMNRPSADGWREYLVGKLRQIKTDPYIAADFIVGFPGESEKDFAESYNFAVNNELTDIHVFRFSPRPKTAAAAMKNTVAATVARQRAQQLRQLAERNKERYIKRWLGKTLELAPVGIDTATGRINEGISANYLTCRLAEPFPTTGAERYPLVKAKLAAVDDDGSLLAATDDANC